MTEELLAAALLALLSLCCLLHLWLFQSERLLRKLAWTFIAAVPLLGPLAYYSLFEPLPGQPELLRARENENVKFARLGDPD